MKQTTLDIPLHDPHNLLPSVLHFSDRNPPFASKSSYPLSQPLKDLFTDALIIEVEQGANIN